MKCIRVLLLTITFTFSAFAEEHATQFDKEIKPFLNKYCVECHGGKKIKGHVNFKAISNMAQAYKKHELWSDVLEVMKDKDMPPEDEPQPTQKEIAVLEKWYQEKFVNIKAKPAVAKLRRLSTTEYRNSLKSLMGFDLNVSVVGTPETVQESSLVLKMLPPDPPGESGFGNDTAKAPLTSAVWEKYNFLTNSAVENLFSAKYRPQLEVYTGPIKGKITLDQSKKLITRFTMRAFKTMDCKDAISQSISRIEASSKKGLSLETAAKKELKSVLLSPQFLFNGHYNTSKKGQQLVSPSELAQRLSYFLWGTIPDDELLKKANDGSLLNKEVVLKQIDRMLNDERSKAFTETLAREWFALDEMLKSKTKWPTVHALHRQPIHFVDYLIREDRPLMELIDSKVTFANNHLNRYYNRKDTSKAPRQSKPKGTEVLVLPHYKMAINNTPERGGILTMPGILSMYSGKGRTSPILRGIWVLERILGDELSEAPMDVPPIPKPKKGEKLTFRQIFERHQSDKSCAVCHQKIDPLGFGMENFDALGNYRTGKGVDSAGKTPDGDKFEDFAGLKALLIKKYRKQIIHTITEKLFVYGLARRLEAYDRPVVDKIAKKLAETNGTYRDLINSVVLSLPFTHTVVQ